jgi:hypothetical protein
MRKVMEKRGQAIVSETVGYYVIGIIVLVGIVFFIMNYFGVFINMIRNSGYKYNETDISINASQIPADQVAVG